MIKRITFAFELGNMGNLATPAIPFLIGMLEDDKRKVTVPFRFVKGLGYEFTSPKEEAIIALEKLTGQKLGEEW